MRREKRRFHKYKEQSRGTGAIKNAETRENSNNNQAENCENNNRCIWSLNEVSIHELDIDISKTTADLWILTSTFIIRVNTLTQQSGHK